MPRPRRTKVAPSAPTVVPFLEKAAARARWEVVNAPSKATEPAKEADAMMSGALPEKIFGSNEEEDMHGVSDKENALPERVPSSMPDENTASTGLVLSKARSTPQTRALKSSQMSSALRQRAQATPRAGDSSVLSLGNFKRRSRQPSLLGIGCADETPSLSSLGDGLTADLDDLDDFQPVDESTPAQTKRPLPGTLAGRKRKSSPSVAVVVNVPRSPARSDSDHSFATLGEFNAGPAADPEPELPTPKRRAVTPPFDSTMAPPRSSPSTPVRSPVAERPVRAARRGQPSKPLSTAALQNLLPRRRAKARGIDIASDDFTPSSPPPDDVSFVPGRAVQRAKRGTQGKQTRAAAARGEKDAPVTRLRRTYGRRSEGDEANDSLVAAEDDDEEAPPLVASNAGPALPSPAKRELARVAAKFREVDDWKMDFESVSGEGVSSPRDAR